MKKIIYIFVILLILLTKLNDIDEELIEWNSYNFIEKI